MSELIRQGDQLRGFYIEQGRCFAMVASKQIQYTHCSEPAPWRGRYVDAKGRMHVVWACDGHAGSLAGVRRATLADRKR